MRHRIALMAVVAAASVPLVLAGSASAAGTRPVAQADTAKQFCSVVQNPVLATAATLLSKLLPKRYQPSASLKTVIGAIAGACPQLADLAVKVHEEYVKLFAPARNQVVVNQPWVSLMATKSMNLSTGETSAFVSWSGLGVASYEEQTRVGSGFDRSILVGAQGPSAYRTVTPGGVYQFYVRGLNTAGQASTGWTHSVPFTLHTYDTWAPNLPGWTNETGRNAYRGTLMSAYASSRPADMKYTADGWAVALVGPRFSSGGTADVYVDGHFVKTISFYSPDAQAGQLVFSYSWASPVRHYITLRPVSGQVALDAGLVLGPA